MRRQRFNRSVQSFSAGGNPQEKGRRCVILLESRATRREALESFRYARSYLYTV